MYKVLLGEKTSTLTLETAIKNNKKTKSDCGKKKLFNFLYFLF